jgi:hypothetical protein
MGRLRAALPRLAACIASVPPELVQSTCEGAILPSTTGELPLGLRGQLEAGFVAESDCFLEGHVLDRPIESFEAPQALA